MPIESRQQIEVNTDPQRRCYNGCHYSSEFVWTSWKLLDHDGTEKRLLFWQGLNDYAVSQRGKSAKREFRITNKGEVR
jgi:hypothetical protein